jgi:VWFA-related protein
VSYCYTSPRKARFLRAGVLCLVVLLSPVLGGQRPPAAQQQQPAPPVFRGGVRLVRVDVSVTGRDDRPPDDLTIGDFEVQEDGVRQEIQTIQYLRLDGQPAPDDDRSLDIRSPEHAEAEAAREDVRLFALFLDDYHLDAGPAVTQPLHRALTAFIERLQPTDLAVLMDPLTPLSALAFTRSKPDLLEAIRPFEGRRGIYFPFRSAVEEAQMRAGNAARLRVQVTLSALAALATRLGGLREGRKTVLFVSQGPPLYFREGDLRQDIRDVVDAANRGNVTIHALDPRGLRVGARFGSDSLYQLTAETGGRLIVNTNEPARELGQVIEDASAYYLLGYTPTRGEDDGRFHRITVRVRRPGLRVLARKGYWAPDRGEVDRARAAAAGPGTGLVAEAVGLLEQTTRRHVVQTWTGVSQDAVGQTALMVTWAPRDRAGDPAISRVDLEAVPAGSMSPSGPPTPLLAAAPGQGGRAPAVVPLHPGPVSLRFTARTAAEEVVERWEQRLAVPDFAAEPVALATPRFHRVRSIAEKRALDAATDPPPLAVRTFEHRDRVFVDLTCYTTPGGQAVQWSAALLGVNGSELRPLQVPAPASGRVRLELPIVGLAPGTYVLKVRASVGTTTAEQLVAFQVVGT